MNGSDGLEIKFVVNFAHDMMAKINYRVNYLGYLFGGAPTFVSKHSNYLSLIGSSLELEETGLNHLLYLTTTFLCWETEKKMMPDYLPFYPNLGLNSVDSYSFI